MGKGGTRHKPNKGERAYEKKAQARKKAKFKAEMWGVCVDFADSRDVYKVANWSDPWGKYDLLTKQEVKCKAEKKAVAYELAELYAPEIVIYDEPDDEEVSKLDDARANKGFNTLAIAWEKALAEKRATEAEDVMQQVDLQAVEAEQKPAKALVVKGLLGPVLLLIGIAAMIAAAVIF